MNCFRNIFYSGGNCCPKKTGKVFLSKIITQKNKKLKVVPIKNFRCVKAQKILGFYCWSGILTQKLHHLHVVMIDSGNEDF